MMVDDLFPKGHADIRKKTTAPIAFAYIFSKTKFDIPD
jgi:hypothetical protein